MKRIEAIIFIILIFIGAGIIMYKLFYKFEDKSNNTTTTRIEENKDGYELISEDGYYKEYLINKKDVNNINLIIDGIKVKVDSGKLFINDEQIISNIEIYRKVYNFEDLYIFFVNYKDRLYDALVIYNKLNKTFKLEYKLNNLYIDLSNASGSKNGILLNTTIVKEDKVINDSGSKDICIYDINAIGKAKTSTMYIYNPNNNNFDDTEEISSMTFESYIVSNKLC